MVDAEVALARARAKGRKELPSPGDAVTVSGVYTLVMASGHVHPANALRLPGTFVGMDHPSGMAEVALGDGNTAMCPIANIRLRAPGKVLPFPSRAPRGEVTTR